MSSKVEIEKDNHELPETHVGTVHVVDPEKAGALPEIDHVAEKKLLRKIDINLITLFGALYLMSFLGMVPYLLQYTSYLSPSIDRSNIGNAVCSTI